VQQGRQATDAWLVAFVYGLLQVGVESPLEATYPDITAARIACKRKPCEKAWLVHNRSFTALLCPLPSPLPFSGFLACGHQDVLVYAPAVLIFFEAVVPLFVRHKIREELDAARKEPIAFKHQIPQGKSSRDDGRNALS
jgi:hypothetical protein